MHSSKLINLIIGTVIVTCLSLNIHGLPVDTDSEIITVPKPGEEYVFVQSSQSGARPIKRKDKKVISLSTADNEPFETGHKIPAFLTFQEKEELEKAKVKREALDTPHPGAIKIDASKLIEKYRDILESTTKQSDVDSTTSNIVLTTGGPSTQRSFEIVHSKNKQGGIHKAGSVNTDAKLTGSGSDKQTSRIQIKKGPNGQDYEYEYVYYYYDDEDTPAGKDSSKTKEEKITNSHDGPARNSITPSTSSRGSSNKNRYQTIDRSNSNTANLNAEPASNEVVPTTSKSSAKSRGRQVSSDEEVISEERLPPNTRFPPRSRNLSTTPSSTSTTSEAPEEHKPAHIRSRTRGKTTPAQEQTEEPATVPSQQSSRQRTRPNVRRPSLELVDSASFKTHASDASVSQYKELSASRDELNQAKLLGESDSQTATSRSFDTADDIPKAQSLDGDDKERFDSKEEKLYDSSTTENAIISTTLTDEMTAAMDKVALDLYAILQGTQNMIQEDDESSSTDNSDSTITTEIGGNPSTEDGSYSTTELSTEESTTPSTTTTTTTTTQATTTTTTTEPSTPPLPGRGRFRGRTTASNRFRQSTPTSTTEASNEVTSKGSRFTPGRTNGFGGRNRLNSRTTEKSIENGEVTKETASVNNNAVRPSIGGNRSRFGSTRGRVTTTSTTAAPNSDSSNSVSAPTPRPSLTRPRPNFNLRRRVPSSTTEASTSTAKSGDGEEFSTETPEPSSTTVRSVRPRISGAARPLRPGPRININSRGRIGAVTTTPSSTTASAVSDDNEKVASEEITNIDSESSESGEASPTSTTTENALQRLRNRARISVNANKPKAPAPAPVVRRTNPLISRRKPIGVQAESTTESHSSEESSSEDKVQNEVTENPIIEEANSEQPAEVSSVSSTTEARGLNGLLAGRRRLNRRPGTIL